METLNKKYGLVTAACMVVGIVIGSGVFFKAQDVLTLTGGNVKDGILAWLIGGAIMIVCASTFAVMATKYEKVNGIIDYAEAGCGKTYAYFMGWFLTFIYYPALSAVISWTAARYTVIALFGVSATSPDANSGPECIAIAALYLIIAYFINAITPKISGKIQVSTTAVKLFALGFVALVGTVIGLSNGTLAANFSFPGNVATPSGGTFAAICSTAFAYDGWIVATAINSEIKNSKRNLPIALFAGSLIVVTVYLLYYVGILGLGDVAGLMSQGTNLAFGYFGNSGARIMNGLVIVSCLGTLNGFMLACSRGAYSIAIRGEGIAPRVFSKVDKATDMPSNSACLGLLLSALWLLYFLGSRHFGWFMGFGFDSSELPIISIYTLFVPILISFIIKEKGLNPILRFVLPSLSIIGSGIMVAASIFRHGEEVIWYLLTFAIVMLTGFAVLLLRKRKPEMTKVE